MFTGERDKFAEELKTLRGEWPLIPVTLRESGLFQDPNAVMNDVAAIIENSKNDILSIGQAVQHHGHTDIIVISRRELRLAVSSSPIQLPGWFPIAKRETVVAKIDDLTWSINVSLSDSVLFLDDVHRLLFEIDKTLLFRIQETKNIDSGNVQSLWNYIRRDDETNIFNTIENVQRTLESVVTPNNFRPSTVRDPTFVGRLWYAANKYSPDRLPRIAKALAISLRTNEMILPNSGTSIFAVLCRPTNPISDIGVLWSFNLIVSIRSACQLVTASAHADQYPLFSSSLLRMTSLDLRLFLDNAIQRLELGTLGTDYSSHI